MKAKMIPETVNLSEQWTNRFSGFKQIVECHGQYNLVDFVITSIQLARNMYAPESGGEVANVPQFGLPRILEKDMSHPDIWTPFDLDRAKSI